MRGISSCGCERIGASASGRSACGRSHKRVAAGAARPQPCSILSARVARRCGSCPAHAARGHSFRLGPQMSAASSAMLSSKTQKCGAPNFNGVAHFYRWMELVTFGPWLQRCRCAFLGELAGCRRAAVLGDGDGRFSAQLLRVNRHDRNRCGRCEHRDVAHAPPPRRDERRTRSRSLCRRAHMAAGEPAL